MNKSILVGRIVRDPELNQTNSGLAVLNFTIAVDRNFRNSNGERETDFIDCVAWRTQAEFIADNFSKGSRIGVVGSLQMEKWQAQDGSNRVAYKVHVSEVHFVESKPSPNRKRETEENYSNFWG